MFPGVFKLTIFHLKRLQEGVGSGEDLQMAGASSYFKANLGFLSSIFISLSKILDKIWGILPD